MRLFLNVVYYICRERKFLFYIVYIDVLFLVNFFMDFLLLLLTSKILKRHTTLLRIFIASIVGTTLFCLSLVYPMGMLKVNQPLYTIAVSILMILLGFPKTELKTSLKILTVFYLTAFTLSGAMNTIYYHTKLGHYFRSVLKGEREGKVSIGVLVGMAIASYITIRVSMYKIQKDREKKKTLYEVTLINHGTKTVIKGLLDTGNSLKEPISRKPINIIELDTAKELFEVDFTSVIENYYISGELQLNADTMNHLNKIRMIPFQSVGESKGMLVAVQIDSLYIDKEGDKIQVMNPYVAIYNKRLSVNNQYKMLLHPELMAN